MSIKSKIALNRIWRTVKGWAVVSLLFLHIIGSSNIEYFHKLLFEHKVTALHKVNNESDPCHITLYHPIDNGGCNHESHFVIEDKCPLCDLQFHSNIIVTACAIKLPAAFKIVPEPNSTLLSITGINNQSTGRSPPFG